MRLRDRVLDLLHRTGKPVSVREAASRLGLDRSQRRDLKAALRALIEQGEVVKIRGARVGLPARMNLVVGRLGCNPAGFGFVAPEAGGDASVYVSAVNLKEALHGDRVVVRVERVTPKGPEGRIIRILERSLRRVVGRFESDGAGGGHVIPFDRRVLHEVFVPPADAGAVRSGEMVVAEVTRPPTATRNPAGRVLDVLGRLEDPGVDLKVVMAKYELPDAFPAEVEAEAARVPPHVAPDDIAGRTDFRGLLTLTIDPETARDHDDAVSLERLAGGGFRLGVHIADVSHYVPAGSALDREACRRGTSVYFPDRVVPMLPHALSSDVCSLVEGQPRLTHSVLMEVDPKGRVVAAEFHDGVIQSAARMSYEQVQRIVDGDAGLRRRFDRLVPLLLDADGLARRMRERRRARGSLDLDLPEPNLVLDADGRVTAILAADRLDSMRMIEEFMLAANEAVAGRLSKAGVGALYRIHERPDPERVEEFRDLVASFGYRVPGDLEQVTPQDFQRVLRAIAGTPEERLVSYLLLRTLKLARYHDENLGHFGLATDMYAHFTSPIRRYPDLLVHRALRGLRRGEAETERLRLALPELGRQLSELERRAAEAERELIEWKKVRFMADKVGEAYAGYVTGVHAFGLFVELEHVYVQGLVHVSSMTDDYYAFDSKAHSLRGESTGQVYRLGDKVEVQVARVDLERRQVDFALVDVVQRASKVRRKGRRDPRAAPPGRARRRLGSDRRHRRRARG